uniref:Uncharacterized protein n=1 Tax=Magallana gigas TaxID=29159 RepID=K1RGG2_MAGGI
MDRYDSKVWLFLLPPPPSPQQQPQQSSNAPPPYNPGAPAPGGIGFDGVSESMFSGGWKDVWVVLYDNSDLCMYNRQGDLEIKAKIHMKDVCKRFAFGDYTSSFPNRPDLPRGSSYEHVLAIPHKNNSQAKVFWFLCRDSNDLQ